jgi:hypothetical protein
MPSPKAELLVKRRLLVVLTRAGGVLIRHPAFLGLGLRLPTFGLSEKLALIRLVGDPSGQLPGITGSVTILGDSVSNRFWGDAVDLHRNRDRQHPLMMLVPQLDRDLTGVAHRKPIPSDLSRSDGGLAFGSIQVVEFKAILIRDEPRALANVKVKARHRVLPPEITSTNVGWSELFVIL